MRITLVMASDEDGGLEKHVLELADGLAETGHRVSVIAHPRYQHQLKQHINFVAFDMSGSRYNPLTKYRLKKEILKTDPEILHAHASKTAKLLQSMLQQFPCPSVVTVHGAKSNLKPYLAFDWIIAVSQRVADSFARPDKTVVVYNGVKITQSPQPYQPNRKFIAIGRLNEVKGFDRLLQAWQQIPHQLTIVGDGEQRLQLEQLVQQLQLADRVTLLGYSDQIAQLLTEHEALIVSSLREGGPYTLSEALLLHRPVIGTDVGMMREFIPQQFLCQPDNVDALSAVIQHYLDTSEVDALFQSAYQHAATELTFTAMIEHTLAVYHTVIETDVKNKDWS